MRMRKGIICIGGLALFCAFTATAFAGAIDNKTNWSAEYIRTLNRNAATDYADIAMYNPAGTVKLHEGFTVNGSIQFLSKEYENNVTLGPTTVYNMESDEPSYIPGIFAVYNNEKFSIFGAFSNVGGGGEVDFSQGSWTTLGAQLYLISLSDVDSLVFPGPQQIKGKSYYLGYTLGAAYALNDMVSFSVGLRYVDAYREAQGSAIILDGTGAPNPPVAIDFEEDGDGWGGTFGVNLAPNDKVNIGIRYETITNIDLEATVKEDSYNLLPVLLGITNGEERPRDLPAIFAFGISYRLTPKIRLETNYTHYFNTGADWGGSEDISDDGYDVGIVFEYLFNEKLTGSIGYMHTELGLDPEYMLPENPELDADTIGAGIAYVINDQFHTNFSIGNSFYEDDSYLEPPLVEYKKNVFFMALGFEYRF